VGKSTTANHAMAYREPRLRPHRFLGWSWGEITSQLQGPQRRQALAVWQWSAIRFSSLGTAQEQHFKRYGAASTYARIDQVRAWLDLAPIGEG
jgi:hypothetical protein